MAIRGEITIECDQPTCHAEIVLSAEDANETLTRHGIDLELHASGWVFDDDGGYVCEQCATENPREKHDDDGVEYGHPRDRMEGRE